MVPVRMAPPGPAGCGQVTRCSHHDAVGLADGPQVDSAVLAARGQQPPGAFPQRQAGDGAGVSLELLCPGTRAGTWLPLPSGTE